MIEKVNPSHPDKVADRIAGALVDLAYKKSKQPKIAVEVLIGHGSCDIIAETSVHFEHQEVKDIVERMTNRSTGEVGYLEVPQDPHLAENQSKAIRCGDNGIFKGVPTNGEEKTLSAIVQGLYEVFPTDGKYIYDEDTNVLIICQSNATEKEIRKQFEGFDKMPEMIINPLGEWTGGTWVDTGATNRKLGSDMGRAVTGGGLHGKDLSKADVSVNIACHLVANKMNTTCEALCAIGDESITFRFGNGNKLYMHYDEVVDMAKDFIDKLGGFEKLAEWGLF